MTDIIKTASLPTMRRDALISQASINEEARTIEITFTTGARRITWSWEEGNGWGGLIEEELALEGADLSRLNSGAPFLKDHAAWSIDNQLGVHVDGSAVIDVAAGVGRATIRFSRSAKVEPIWQDVKDRILRQTSVGYNVNKYVVTREEGKLPLYRAVEWTPLENSLVTIGADPGAQLRSETKPTLHPCTIITRNNAVPKAATKPTEKRMNPNQIKKRAMSDDIKTKCKDILKEAGVAEDKLDEYTDKIAALWPEETAAPASGDMTEAARALGVSGEPTMQKITAAAKSLRSLYDAKDKALDEQETSAEVDEFEVNAKKGLHRKLDALGKDFARDLYNNNRDLYRGEVGKVKPLDAKSPAAASEGQRNTIAKVANASADAERQINTRAAELMKADPKLDEQEAYRQAFKEHQAKLSRS